MFTVQEVDQIVQQALECYRNSEYITADEIELVSALQNYENIIDKIATFSKSDIYFIEEVLQFYRFHCAIEDFPLFTNAVYYFHQADPVEMEDASAFTLTRNKAQMVQRSVNLVQEDILVD